MSSDFRTGHHLHMIGIGNRNVNWLVSIIFLGFVLGACSRTCDAGEALKVAEADSRKKGSHPEDNSWKVHDEGSFWVVEGFPPPGTAGGGSVHEINKEQCSVRKADFFL